MIPMIPSACDFMIWSVSFLESVTDISELGDSWRFCLVIVLVDGNDKAKLESTPMPDFDHKGFGQFLTAGVWGTV